jgi:hypothetical protein
MIHWPCNLRDCQNHFDIPHTFRQGKFNCNQIRFTGHVIYEIVRITSPTNQVPVARLALTKPGIRNIGPP